MRHLETEPLTGINQTQIDPPKTFDLKYQGREIGVEEVVANTPALTSSYDGTLDAQMVLGLEGDIPFWDSKKYYPVGKLAAFHGRSLDILAPSYVEDQFGNSFSSLSIKGSNLSDPHFMKSATAERDHIIHGLQESLVMERVLKASRILRENKVGTEYIFGLALPTEFPLSKEKSPFDIKESVELPDLLEYLAGKFAQEETKVESGDKNTKSPLEIKAEMMDKFSDCDYIVSYRAMDCSVRMSQLCIGEHEDEPRITEMLNYFRKIIGKEYADKYLPAEMTRLDYISDFLAVQVGSNLAYMHKVGIRHGFLHTNNMTAMGSLVDLDSCRGEILGFGDKPTTDADCRADITEAIESIHHVIGDTFVYPHTPDQEIEEMKKRHIAKSQASAQLLANYVFCRFDTDEERGKFIIDYLISNNTSTESAKQSSSMHLRETLVNVYLHIVNSSEQKVETTDTLEIEHIDIPKRKDMPISVLPGDYFVKHGLQIIGQKASYEDESDDTKMWHHYAAYIKDLLIEALSSSIKTDDTSQHLKIINFVKSIKSTNKDSPHPKVDQFHQDILSILACNDLIKENPELHHKLSPLFPDIAMKTGTLKIEEGHITTLYVEDDEYDDVFKYFNIKPGDNIGVINVDQENMPLSQLSDQDVLLINAERIEALALHSAPEVLETLAVIHHRVLVPTMLIKNAASDNPKFILLGDKELELYGATLESVKARIKQDKENEEAEEATLF